MNTEKARNIINVVEEVIREIRKDLNREDLVAAMDDIEVARNELDAAFNSLKEELWN